MKNSLQELRFVVTQKCTNSCFFCHGEGLQEKKISLLDADDIAFVFDASYKYFGCDLTTLTGGEPLLRSDIIDIAKKLFYNSGKVTLATNGFLLEDRMAIGNYIDRLNVSIHSLNPKTYELITQRSGAFNKVINSLIDFRQNFPSIKIRLNSTLLRGYNFSKEAIEEVLKFANRIDASVKFVELYPPTADEFVPVKSMENYLLRHKFLPIASTTRKKDYSDGLCQVGLTKIFCSSASDYDDPSAYCAANNDLFISPDGRIKPCRHNPKEIDILSEIKNRDSDGLYQKLSLAFSLLGQDCCVAKQKKNRSVGVKCTRVN